MTATPTSATEDLVRRLRGTVLPAVATPMDPGGVVDFGALRGYAERIAAERIGGVAVWAHTGRGLHLSESDRLQVLRTWREAVQGPIVAGAGVPRSARASNLREAWDATVAMAVQAADLGADAVMVYPLAQFASRPAGEGRRYVSTSASPRRAGCRYSASSSTARRAATPTRPTSSAGCSPCRRPPGSNSPRWTARWPARTRSARRGRAGSSPSPARTGCSARP